MSFKLKTDLYNNSKFYFSIEFNKNSIKKDVLEYFNYTSDQKIYGIIKIVGEFSSEGVFIILNKNNIIL